MNCWRVRGLPWSPRWELLVAQSGWCHFFLPWTLDFRLPLWGVSVCVYVRVCPCACVCAHTHTQSCSTLATPGTIADQAPLFMGLSRQEYWSRLPFPSPLFQFSFQRLHRDWEWNLFFSHDSHDGLCLPPAPLFATCFLLMNSRLHWPPSAHLMTSNYFQPCCISPSPETHTLSPSSYLSSNVSCERSLPWPGSIRHPLLVFLGPRPFTSFMAFITICPSIAYWIPCSSSAADHWNVSSVTKQLGVVCPVPSVISSVHKSIWQNQLLDKMCSSTNKWMKSPKG